MDLRISYTDASMNEVAFLDEFVFDSDVGQTDTFSLTVKKSLYNDLKDAFIFVWDDFSCGGKITSVVSNSDSGLVTFSGRTWRGLLEDKFLTFSSSYRNDTIGNIINEILEIVELGEIMKSEQNDRVTATGIGGFSALQTISWMFESVDSILFFDFDQIDKKVVIRSRKKETYNQDEYSSIVFPCEVEIGLHPYTEVFCKSESSVSATAYLQKDGSVGKNRYFTGANARCLAVFENTQSESESYSLAANKLIELQAITNVNVKIGNVDEVVMVGDFVETIDETTGIRVIAKVVSKSLHMTNKNKMAEFQTDKKG